MSVPLIACNVVVCWFSGGRGIQCLFVLVFSKPADPLQTLLFSAANSLFLSC